MAQQEKTHGSPSRRPGGGVSAERPMKIGILSRNSRLYSTRRLRAAGEMRGHQVEIIDPLRCYMSIASRKVFWPTFGGMRSEPSNRITSVSASNEAMRASNGFAY